MRTFVALTDWDWFQHLRSMEKLEDVNFWKPGGRQRFRALQPGELFLFKLHSPKNYVVGGGIFSYSTILPVSLAWESFRESNGAASYEQMRQRIERHRKTTPAPFEDYAIGCVLLAKPFFLSEPEWIPIPDDWGRGIQQGKRYPLDHGPGALLYRNLEHALSREASGPLASMQVRDVRTEIASRYGAPMLVAPRLGQGTFRVIVTDAYERQCAITGEKVLPVLQAAHIRPFAKEGPNRVQNGILLRSDLHTLFDRGYLTVTPELHIEVSRRLHEDFDNGREYDALRGHGFRTPRKLELRPDRELLEWHNQNVYRD